MSDSAPGKFPVTTGFELPGMVVDTDLGLAFGLVVRSMGIAKSFGASFSAMRQGHVSQYTQLLEDSRRHAIDRMVWKAQPPTDGSGTPGACRAERETGTPDRGAGAAGGVGGPPVRALPRPAQLDDQGGVVHPGGRQPPLRARAAVRIACHAFRQPPDTAV